MVSQFPELHNAANIPLTPYTRSTARGVILFVCLSVSLSLSLSLSLSPSLSLSLGLVCSASFTDLVIETLY